MGSLCQCPESHEILGKEVNFVENEMKNTKNRLLTNDENDESCSLMKSGNNFFNNTSNRYSRIKNSKRKFMLQDKFEIEANSNFQLNLQKSLEITNNSIVNECKKII
jgi:hypothetical protein